MTDWLGIAWLVATLLGGLAAGAMTGHALLLGRFFGWMLAGDRVQTFRDIYPPFIAEKRANVLFDNLFAAALVAVTVYAILAWWMGRAGVLVWSAAALQLGFLALFFASGFAALENELLVKGSVTERSVSRFLALNSAITTVSALLLAASFVCLALARA